LIWCYIMDCIFHHKNSLCFCKLMLACNPRICISYFFYFLIKCTFKIFLDWRDTTTSGWMCN
jgi:hypothetical protein